MPIHYDRPVKNLIPQLDATGHVTHRSYKKTSVTIHHNGGRLSHEGVLNVWKTRPASAHFDVDAHGDVAQYVRVHEYAWAAGNTFGNMRSIHIEMCNSTLSPNWEVGSKTWKGAARLAGYLFVHEVGARPTKNNFFVHHHWLATLCAGPFIDKHYNKVLKEAQKWYDHFNGTPNTTRPPSSSASSDYDLRLGDRGKRVRTLQRGLNKVFPAYSNLAVDGSYGYATQRVVKEFQRRSNLVSDGICGPRTQKELRKYHIDL